MIFLKAVISTAKSSSSACVGIPVQAQLSRSRGNDGRTRIISGSYDDHALNRTLCSGIRKAVEPICRQAGGSWRVDETYVKIKGRWTYLYRAVDKQGKTVDFLLRAKRDVAAAKAFFRRAFKSQADCRAPSRLTATKPRIGRRGSFSANIGAASGPKSGPSKYLNNLIEQDHRSIKLRLGPMLGLKRFRSASTTIAGIELIHRIRKGQFNLGELRNKDNRAPAVWNAVLAA